MKTCGIYSFTNIINGKKLIGQSVNIESRHNHHLCMLRNSKHNNTHLQSAWNHYGETNFKFEIILQCLPQELDTWEISLIKQFNTTNRENGYNIEGGGNEFRSKSEETKRKIGAAHKGKIISIESRLKMSKSRTGMKRTEETKNKIRQSHIGMKHAEESKLKMGCRGEDHPRWGKQCSEETKRKISASNKGKIISEECRKKISQTLLSKHYLHPMLGKKHSEESRLKMSKSHIEKQIGENNPFYGKKHSEETKAKMREAQKKYQESRLLVRS